ncbi:MAG: IclR family transcriptional regulator [Pseudolabrys sp.]
MRPNKRTVSGNGAARRAAAPAKPVRRVGPGVDEDSRNLVNSLAKGLRVLEAFSAERTEMTLSEIGVLARLDPGTVFRMLNTLVMLGYVSRVPDSRRFRLTLKVTDLGLHAIGGADLRETARPILRSMVGELNEAASLGVLDGADVLYIDRVRAGLTRIGVDIRIGTTIPAHCSAIGQAILAYLPQAELSRLLASQPRSGNFPSKPMTKDEIKRDLADVRTHGYALRDSFFGSGLRILAAPVLDVDKYPVAAVSVAAPAVRMSSKEFRSRALEPMRRAVKDIARAIQASGTISAIA